jgi:hypothetical protein
VKPATNAIAGLGFHCSAAAYERRAGEHEPDDQLRTQAGEMDADASAEAVAHDDQRATDLVERTRGVPTPVRAPKSRPPAKLVSTESR